MFVLLYYYIIELNWIDWYGIDSTGIKTVNGGRVEEENTIVIHVLNKTPCST